MAEKDESELLGGVDRAFARALKDRRESRGWSQGQLAEMLRDRGFGHLSQVGISRIEQGKRAARLGEARAIAGVLGIPLSVMMAPSANVIALLSPVFDRPGTAIQQLDVAKDHAEVTAQTWAQLREDLAFVEQVQREMSEDLKDEPETADEITRYLTEVGILLKLNPAKQLSNAFEEAHRAAAADPDQ